ncbi:hypothetical protein [Salmonella phage ST38]|nr:hypothetical protein [Salmonella phage ST38]
MLPYVGQRVVSLYLHNLRSSTRFRNQCTRGSRKGRNHVNIFNSSVISSQSKEMVTSEPSILRV